MKNESYYQISGWMINKLKLKGIELNIYAIIYGFSQDGESEFKGSLKYLSEFTGGTSKPTLIKALKDLTEKQFIIRREEIINKVKFNRYRANLPLLKEFDGGGKETLQGGGKETLQGGGKETLPNNKLDNNKYKEIKKEINKENPIEKILESYTQNETTLDLLHEWLKVRKAQRAANTERSIELNIKKLDKLAKQSNLSVDDYLKEAIARSWRSFFPITDFKFSSNKQPNDKTYSGYRNL